MRRDRLLRLLPALTLAPWAAARATPVPTLTISTANTPTDRLALERLGHEAFRRAGLGLKLVHMPSERSLVAANQGEVDGEGLRVEGLESQYPNLVRVPERFTGVSFVAFSRDPTISLANGWASLKPHRVAYLNGWKVFEANTVQARAVHKVDKAEQLFEMLRHDRIDLALYTLADGLVMVRQLGLVGVAALQPSLREADMYLYLHRRHAAHAAPLAMALKDMRADGSWRRIVATIGQP